MSGYLFVSLLDSLFCQFCTSCIYFVIILFYLLSDAYFVPSAFGLTDLIPVIVSPMEHKRDATVAGLGWPSTSNRGTSSTDPDTRPGYQAFEMSGPAAPAHSTSTTSASPEANTILNDPGTTSPIDTYSAPTQPDVPFPTQQSSTFNVFHHARFSSRVVHQIQFKIFTHSNNTRELFIEEIPTSGIPNVVIPNTIFTVSLATGSGLYGQRTIGAIILSSLYYMGIIPSTMFPSSRSLLLMNLA